MRAKPRQIAGMNYIERSRTIPDQTPQIPNELTLNGLPLTLNGIPLILKA